MYTGSVSGWLFVIYTRSTYSLFLSLQSEPLSNIIPQIKLGMDMSGEVELRFDGDLLDVESSANDVELEDGDLVEVSIVES